MPLNEHGPFPLRGPGEEEVCRHCGASLIGDPVPDQLRAGVGGVTHYRREIGVETRDYDGLLYFYCPECWLAWSRWTGDGPLTAAAVAAVMTHNTRIRDEMPVVLRTLGRSIEDVNRALAEHDLPSPGAWRYDPCTGSIVLILAPVETVDDNVVTHVEAHLTQILGTRVCIECVGAQGPGWHETFPQENAGWPGSS